MKILFLFFSFIISVYIVQGQSTLPLRADTIVMEKNGGNANFKLKDASRDSVGGLLTNIGNGVYRGKKPRKLNDSTLLIGIDTIHLAPKKEPENLDSTLKVGNIDSATAIQFGYPVGGYVQFIDGINYTGIPMFLLPYTYRDTNIVTPRRIDIFKTYTNSYDGTEPLNTITEIAKYGSNNLSDHYFRIAFEQNYYHNGEFHGFEYKLNNVGPAIRGMSATWNWDTPDLSTTTWRAGQFAFQPSLSDTQMLYLAPNLARIINFRTASPQLQLQQYSTDGTKGGLSATTNGGQTLWNWHLNSSTFHVNLHDYPYESIIGSNRNVNSSDPEIRWAGAGRLSNNRIFEWTNGALGYAMVMEVDADGLLSTTVGGNHFMQNGSLSLMVKSLRNRHQKPFAIAISSNAADTFYYKVPFATDTLGRIAINLPDPNNAIKDGLIGLTDQQDFRVYGLTLLDSTTYINNIIAPPSSYTLLVHGSTDSIVYQIPSNGLINGHSITTPSTGGTVNLINNQYNIINPAGTLATLTVNLPSSPSNNDRVEIKYTQAITAVTYGNGTVVDGVTGPIAGQLVVLVYDSGTNSWY